MPPPSQQRGSLKRKRWAHSRLLADYRPKPFLCHLPPELIEMICMPLEWDKTSLTRLARVCKYFVCPARKVLLEDVCLGDFYGHKSRRPTRIVVWLLLRTIMQNPVFEINIRVLRFGTVDPVDTYPTDDYSFALMYRLHSLRSLEIRWATVAAEFYKSRFPKKNLKAVSLRTSICISEIWRYMLLPRLQEFHAPDINFEEVGEFGTDSTSTNWGKFGGSSLSKLSIWSSFHTATLQKGIDIRVQDLGHILKWPASLKELTCTIPIDSSDSSRPGRRWNREWRFHSDILRFSPAAITAALRPTRHSLEKLKLTHAPWVNWKLHDGTQLNLRRFRSLEHIEVQSLALLSTLNLSLSHLLPRSLKVLWVSISVLVPAI